jgi:hypothetical protein
MSMAEIKEEVSRMSKAERQELAAFLAIQSRIKDEEWLDEMDRRFEEMKAGNAVPQDQVRAMHERLCAEGR